MSVITIELADAVVGAKEQATKTREHWAALIAANAGAQYDPMATPGAADIEKVLESQAAYSQWLIRRMTERNRYAMTSGGWNTVGADSVMYSFSISEVYSVLDNDATGQLRSLAVEKFCAHFSRQLYELKHLDRSQYPADLPDLSYIQEVDWTPSSDGFMAVNFGSDSLFYHGGKYYLRVVRDGETFLGGFFTEQDRRRFRYTTKRLGAVLASFGLSDGEVREIVERDKQRSAGANFIVYPNDITWSELYRGGTDSCMSKPANNYDSYDAFGMHPVDVYCSAYHGAGDNGLSLITTQDHNGNVVGRGIYHRRTNAVVRWYGDHVAMRALYRLGIEIDDFALNGSWLALINDSRSFVHPYVDGCYDKGDLDEGSNRILLTDDGDYDLQDTNGLSYMGRRVWIESTDEYVREDEATYCPYQDQYVADYDADNYDQCYINDEPCVTGADWVHCEEDGEYVYICHAAYVNLFRYCREVEGWVGYMNKEGEECIRRV